MTLARHYYVRVRRRRTASTRARIRELIVRAQVRVAHRVATKPSRAAKVRRVEAKAKRGAVKQGRGRVDLD